MLTPWKKSYDQPRQHIKKQRHYPANKGLSGQSYGFPVVMYGCEIWTIKKAEHQRIDVFELWFWRRLLRVLWTARRSNQSILKEISPEYSKEWCWSWNSNTWPPDAKNWLRKDPDAGKDWSQEEKRMTEWKGWIASPIRWIWVWVCSGSWWWTGKPVFLQFLGSQRVGHNWATELNWTKLNGKWDRVNLYDILGITVQMQFKNSL